jgi:hypothetical protein
VLCYDEQYIFAPISKEMSIIVKAYRAEYLFEVNNMKQEHTGDSHYNSYSILVAW